MKNTVVVIHARYNEATGKWHLKLRRPVSGVSVDDELYEIVDDTADFVLAGLGTLSRWSWPDIHGLGDFKGKLIHSAGWEITEGETWKDGLKDWVDKKVGVIGVGSSALQIVPAVRPFVKHVYKYVRGKTWLAPPFASQEFSELMKRDPTSENYVFSPEDMKSFDDPAFYKEFRHDLESAVCKKAGKSRKM